MTIQAQSQQKIKTNDVNCSDIIFVDFENIFSLWESNRWRLWIDAEVVLVPSQPAFACSKSMILAIEKYMKYVQS